MASSNFVRTGLHVGFAAVLLVTSIACLAKADDIVGRPPASGQTDLTIGEGAFRHLQALQEIATANGGNRAAGTVGYDRSAQYVAERLRQAGYSVRFEEFEFPFFEEKSPPVLLTSKPDGSPEPAPNNTVRTLAGSGSREVEARLHAVNLQLTELPAAAQIEGLDDHLLDLGFMRSPAQPVLPAGLTAQRLLRENLFVAMRPDHPLAAREALHFSDLADVPQLLYAQDLSSGFTEELMGMFRAAGVEPLIAQRVREVTTLFSLAATGIGVTILAESLCSLQSASLVYRPLVDACATTSLWLLHRADGMTLPCRHFMDILALPE